MSRTKEAALIVGKGFCMGAADVVPGVSGGTMAFILGIYQRLLNAIRSFDVALARLVLRGELRAAFEHIDLKLLGPLALGIFAALMFFTRVVPLPALIVSDPEPVYGLFFGLIVASAVVLLRDTGRLSLTDKLLLAVGIAAGLTIVNLVPVSTPETAWFVFLSGALAICAMILPGISGSFILLILGKYAYVFDAIGKFHFGIILPFAMGAAAGLMAFSRVLTWLLRHHYQRTLVTITGLLIGSLWMVWPFQERSYALVRGKSRLIHSSPIWPQEFSGSVALAVTLMIVGLLFVLGLHAVFSRRALHTHA